jgi:hypothetical protein
VEKLKPNFGWLPIERIMRTLAVTTQFFQASPMREDKTCFPAANVNQLDEIVAMDTFFAIHQHMMMESRVMVVQQWCN